MAGFQRTAGLELPLGSSGVTDEDLALDSRENLDAFSVLYGRYADRVYRYALARTGDAAQADDVVSDTMVRAMERIDRFDPELGTFAGWLFTIASRRISDRQRAHYRFLRLLSRWRHHDGTAPDPVETAIDRERIDRLIHALNRLSHDHREVIALRHIADLSTRETAEALDITESAVRVRLHRALNALTEEMGDSDA
jgi:RNA polymerase sigma-70 factor, ECF subfamily